MAVFKDEVMEEVQKSLPCIDCVLSGICRHAGNVRPVENLPEIFEVHYVCSEKEKYTK